MTEEIDHRPKRARSPNYPGIALDEAIERARVLYHKEGKHAAPVAAAYRDLGYSPGSGQGGVVLAALKKFGLVDDTGSGNARAVRLTEIALRIILDERPESPERLSAIQAAALTPPIHAELWQQYGPSLPSDETLLFRLQTEKGFTKGGAIEFLREFKDTIEFARLTEAESLGADGDQALAENREEMGPFKEPAAERRRPRGHDGSATVISFQISDRLVEISTAGGPLTKDEIGILKEYLSIQERIAPTARSTGDPEPTDDP